MIIRNTKMGDYKDIYVLLTQEWKISDQFTKKTFGKMLERNKGYYFVCVDKNRVIGNIFASHDGGYQGHIYRLFVDKNYRKRKVGTRLIETVLKKFKKDKINWVYCHIKKDNIHSINLFKKFGFSERQTHGLFDIYKSKK